VNGARALIATLAANGVTTWFANPGTSEMHLVGGLDESPESRAVLCLFEGVATGAADGYARVTGRPAATLLHLGPGLANGWSNLHDARRAFSPVVNVVGDYATFHARYDSPLASDIAGVASALKGWVRASQLPDSLPGDGADAVAAAYGPPGRVSTLIVAADAAWGELSAPPAEWPRADLEASRPAEQAMVDLAAKALRAGDGALLLGAGGCTAEPLALASRVAAATGAKVLHETTPGALDHGAGVAEAERLIYLSEFALAQLADRRSIVLVGAPYPAGFFGYPGLASDLVAPGCQVVDLAPPGVDARLALEALVDALGAGPAPVAPGEPPARPSGELTAASMAQAVGATLPEGLVVVDESVTSGVHVLSATRFSPPHRWLGQAGHALGNGLPLAVGAAIATGSRVLCLEADGSAMYTPQALWTMAREGLDVTVVVLANRRYAILEFERRRVDAPTGAATDRLLRLDAPEMDFAGLARSLGVPAARVESAESLAGELERSYATPGPSLIEAVLPAGL
jgi:acetolactate synthase I/II/III large subunit